MPVNTPELIQTVLIYALPVLFAITVHEAAHGYAARYFGDDTAAQMGRLTLNPLRHIDPVGTVLMPLLLYVATAGALLFGYARPVPVRVDRLRKPKSQMTWVALAGPGANFVMAWLWGLGLSLLLALHVDERFFLGMCKAGVLCNVVMCVFNLFPMPPLDGGRILVGLLPWRFARPMARLEPWGFYIVMALMLIGIVERFWMRPLMNLCFTLLEALWLPFGILFT